VPKNDVFDFVVIDGPGRWMQDGELITLENGDIIRFLPYLADGCKVYMDGRRSTVNTVLRYCSKYFKIIEDNNKYTLLEKNKVQIKSLDDLQSHDIKLAQSKKYLDKNIVINLSEKR